jgi:diguanylate cyclase (GGDEF)-like protein/PAS domain S-box-containing protein
LASREYLDEWRVSSIDDGRRIPAAPMVVRSAPGARPGLSVARGDGADGMTEEVTVLIERLLETSHRLEELTDGEIDSVADGAGRVVLLPRAQAELRRSEALKEGRYRALLEAAPDAMVVVDQAGKIVLFNVQAEKQFGYSRDELVGQAVTNIIPHGFAERLVADDLRSADEALAQVIGTGIELVARRKDGTEFPIEIMLSPVHSTEGILVTAAIRDITTRTAMSLQAAYTAHHDPLTGLPNRVLLNDRISQAIALAPRHSKQVAVLFLDLDGFKHINDSLGHAVGDSLLHSVATRLTEQVRGSDTVSRQGGDEFVVLLSEAEEWVDAAAVAKRMISSVSDVHRLDGHDLRITTSIGISVFPQDGGDAETLIKNADTAMYQAKDNGRNGIQFFRPEMNVRAVERQSIEQSLRVALEREEFVLHYQPKIDLASGRVIGAEALIRWRHPTRGLVLPAEFIPVAEQSGLIVPIGRWVLREACRQMRAWLDAGVALRSIAVNVSAVDLGDEGFFDEVLAALGDGGLNARFLDLELTETALMKRIDATAAILQRLRERGVEVSLDDFGTGYSSLSYLHRFPIDTLKIDQSFVSQISVESGAPIVAGIVGMARSLKLRVVAEGVETATQLAFLRGLACDEVQGYYFSCAVPPADFAAYVRQRAAGPVIAPARPETPATSEPGSVASPDLGHAINYRPTDGPPSPVPRSDAG